MNDVAIPSIFVGDQKQRSISFRCTEDCEGELLIADVYVIGDTDPTARVSSGNEVGGRKEDIIDMTLDFQELEPGGYACKIFTVETGVIAKFIVRNG